MQDKLAFILNNLTTANLSQKTPELRRLLTQERWPWFCNYLVVRRAAQVRISDLRASQPASSVSAEIQPCSLGASCCEMLK